MSTHVCATIAGLSRRVGMMSLLTLLVALTFDLSAAAAFTDVPESHRYHEAITHLYDEEIVTGFPDGSFRPDGSAWRQHFAKMAVLTFDLPVSEADVCPFGDVEIGGPLVLYPDNFVAVAAAEGLTRGVTATSFDPYGAVTRAQAVTMVVRGLENLHPGLLETLPETFVGTWGDFSPDHGPTARTAEYNGLLAGLGGGDAPVEGDLSDLDPWSAMPRGELAQLLHNTLVLLESEEPPVPPTLETIHAPDAAVTAWYGGCAGGAVCHQLNLLAEHTARGLSCDACHGTDAPPQAAAAIAAYASTGEKQGCFVCHDAGAFHGDATDAHRAAPGGTCVSCHLVDLPAEHARASSSTAAAGCAACHPLDADFTWSGQCTACHTSGGPAPAVHAAVPAHPSSPEGCGGTGCHSGGLANIHGAGGCATCHSTTSVPTDTACSACHADGTFHGDAAAGHRLGTSAGSCVTAGCHPGADLPDVHGDDCATCHNATQPKTNECAGCHGSAGPHVVPEPYKDSCDRCHAIGRPGAALHDTHAVGLGAACASCHSTSLPSCVSAACHRHDTAAIHSQSQHQAVTCTVCHTSGAPGHGPSPFKYGLAPSQFQQPCLTSGCHEHKSHMDNGNCISCHGPGGNRDVHTEEERHVRDRATCAICHDLSRNSFTDCRACHPF